MDALRVMYAIWLREVKLFVREPSAWSAWSASRCCTC